MSTTIREDQAPDLFEHLEARGLLDAAIRRLKRFAGLGAVLAVLAGNLSPGGLTGVVLTIWTAIGAALAIGGGLMWLAARAYAAGDLPLADERSVETGSLPAIGAVLTTALARRAYSSAGARVLWEAAFGAGSLPPDGLADASDSLGEEDVRSISQTLRRLALVSVGLVGLDLLVRYRTSIAAVLGFVDQRGVPSLADIALAPVEWLGLYGAVILVGALVGFLLAVTYR